MKLSSLLLAAARSPLAGRFLRWWVTHMSFTIPGEHLYETSHLLAFYHPQPSYPFHVLILPKSNLRSLMDLTEENAAFLVDLSAAVQSLVRRFDLESRGYRLIANGGAYQDVDLLHFHLISG